MEIHTLCDEIQLQPEIKSRVFDFVNAFDFTAVDRQLIALRDYEKMSEALAELQTILGEDTDNIKILACMLKASADLYDIYKEMGISDEIYFATMKCYTRFINETHQMTGRLYFDRYWWTTRQAGCHLFRIGELEYEMKHIDDSIVIGIHIPSDADFSPSKVDDSITNARRFFSKYYPELSDTEYRCHSWLLESYEINGLCCSSRKHVFTKEREETSSFGRSNQEYLWEINMNVFIARHGETEWNKANRVCGRTDIELTENGKDQAERLAEKLAANNIDLIISSPLKRATQTSKIISEICNAPVGMDDRLIEQDYGIYEGADRQNPDFLANKRNFAYRYPNGESMMQVAARVYPLLEELKEKYVDKNILLLCHGGVCRVLKTYFQDMTNEEFFKYVLPNAEFEKFTL